MSETVIPERWKAKYAECMQNPYSGSIIPGMLEELGAAEQERDQLRDTLLQHPDYPKQCEHKEKPWYCDSCAVAYKAEMQLWHERAAALLGRVGK